MKIVYYYIPTESEYTIECSNIEIKQNVPFIKVYRYVNNKPLLTYTLEFDNCKYIKIYDKDTYAVIKDIAKEK